MAEKNQFLGCLVGFRGGIWRVAALLVAMTSPPVSADSNDPMVLYDDRGLLVRSHLQFGINVVSESNLYWNFADTFAPNSGFDSDANWIEYYVKPGLSFEKTLGDGTSFYGMISAVGSYTSGIDAFDTGDTGRTTLEEAYLGVKTDLGTGAMFDFSLGPRELKLGTGMLIANGGSSGFERGALKFGPRKAWEMAAIASVSNGGVTAQAFYLQPNELPSKDSGNKLAGVDLRYDDPSGGYVGLSYINVLSSTAPYPQAAPGGIGAPMVTPGARKGLNALNFYAKTNPFEGAFENLTLSTDLAYEWNDRIDLKAWGGRVQASYTFAGMAWSPVLTYSIQAFSGDNPNTTAQERFDPLYYEGSPSAWSTGSKSSMVFINSNVMAHGLALRLQPTPKDTVTFRYTHIRALKLRSPLQFGQSTRLDFSNGLSTVISGVTDAHLSDDFFIEYNRIINRNTYLTAGVSVSLPGQGIKNAVGGSAPNWTGGFINVVFNY